MQNQIETNIKENVVRDIMLSWIILIFKRIFFYTANTIRTVIIYTANTTYAEIIYNIVSCLILGWPKESPSRNPISCSFKICWTRILIFARCCGIYYKEQWNCNRTWWRWGRWRPNLYYCNVFEGVSEVSIKRINEWIWKDKAI